MTQVTLRRIKGSPLTNDEVDDNFQALNSGKESTANKGVANGYASLDSGGKVPLVQIPDGIGGGGGGSIGNLDGGDADTGYGALTTVDGGGA